MRDKESLVKISRLLGRIWEERGGSVNTVVTAMEWCRNDVNEPEPNPNSEKRIRTFGNYRKNNPCTRELPSIKSTSSALILQPHEKRDSVLRCFKNWKVMKFWKKMFSLNLKTILLFLWSYATTFNTRLNAQMYEKSSFLKTLKNNFYTKLQGLQLLVFPWTNIRQKVNFF